MFQRLMSTVLADVSAFLAAYLDDVSIHLVHLDEVISRLDRAGLTLKASKCQLGCRECQYLGHGIGNEEYDRNRTRLKQCRTLNDQRRRKMSVHFWV